jgi:beta-glucosidase
VVDSVNGVKGSQTFNGTKTLCFPSTTCLASTWNKDLIYLMGGAVGRQAKSKAAQVILGPTLNMHRDPRAGRNFECFSEDPLLTGVLAASMVNGIQGEGVAACPKHFVANDSETRRRYYNVNQSVNSRAMREIYLGAFQTMLRFSDPAALMTA